MPRFTGTRYPTMFGGSQFLPSDLANLELWTRFNKGITVTGAGVSQWDDQSGNGNHLLQGTDTNRPSKEADGSILFDGVDNYLQATFTLNQPCSWYILGKWVVWSTNHVMNGVTANVAVFGNTATPGVALYAGTGIVALNNDWAVGTYAPLAAVFDGANSLTQVGSNSPTTGNPGASDPGGFTLGNSDVVAAPSNIQVKECVVYSAAHDLATRTKVINYLNSI